MGAFERVECCQFAESSSRTMTPEFMSPDAHIGIGKLKKGVTIRLPRMMMLAKNFLYLISIGVCVCLLGCKRSSNSESRKEVVVYTSLDRPHSLPILQLFEKRTGIRVKAVYDAEASKTVGLANRLMAEKNSPQADVFWNSEVSRTIVLRRHGVLLSYQSASAKDIPSEFKDPEGYWTGFAARGRILLCGSNLPEIPTSIEDFKKEIWRGRFSIANPLFGTTATQVAALYELWGGERSQNFLIALKNNDAVVASGNATARDMVVSGEIDACFTDSDDAFGAILNGKPVKMVIPDQAPHQVGMLLIPNTVCLVAGGPNSENGKKLIDFLLSPEVEEILAFSPSGQIPLRRGIKTPDYVPNPDKIKLQHVDFESIANQLDTSSRFVREQFLN